MTESKKPLGFYKRTVPFKAVQIQVLNKNKSVLSNATGFIISEAEGNYLYTCWHVVTGFELNNLQIKSLPDRKYLRINYQKTEVRTESINSIGGIETYDLNLYNESCVPSKPVWYQDRQHVSNLSLNSINLKVPFWNDAVKIKLPDDLIFSSLHLITEDEREWNGVNIGDKVLIAGYPYGFSAEGDEKPTPVILTRFIAAMNLGREGYKNCILLDGPGAPAMSGSPVFLETETELKLVGIYAGAIFPDFKEKKEKTTSLGYFCGLNMCWYQPFVDFDSPLQEPIADMFSASVTIADA